MLKEEGNVLLLDEPTNDLDILTLQILEDFLLDYQGCLLLVSHDRYFLDKLTDHLFVFEGNGKIKDFNGNYKDYRVYEKAQAKLNIENAISSSKPESSVTVNDTPKAKLSFKEKQELEKLDKDIEQLETEKKDLTAKISSSTVEHSELIELSQKIEKVIQNLEEKELRWLELSELA